MTQVFCRVAARVRGDQVRVGAGFALEELSEAHRLALPSDRESQAAAEGFGSGKEDGVAPKL